MRPRPIVLAWWIWALVIAGAIALVVWATPVRAEQVDFDCVDLAIIVASAADFRDAGAQLDKTLAIARVRNSERSRAHLAVIEREIRRVWDEKRSRRLATLSVYRRCIAQLGDMGWEG